MRIALVLAALFLPFAAGAATTSQITDGAITWSFQSPAEFGQFITGDYWVVGPVTITRVTPDFRTNCGKNGNDKCHGMEKNPPVRPWSQTNQAYDSRNSGGETFDNSLLVTVPHTAQPGDSLVKVESWDTGNWGGQVMGQCGPAGSPPNDNYTCIESTSILTVLASPPPPNSFRPPYNRMSGPKPIHTLPPTAFAGWPSVPTVGNTPTVSQVEGLWNCPIIDHWVTPLHRNFHGRQCIKKPNGNAADYDAEIAAVGAMTLLRTMHDDVNDAQRISMLASLVQFGIDVYYMIDENAPNFHYAPWGGYGSGRKLPILVAGRVLGHAGMSSIGTTYGGAPDGWRCGKFFAEDGGTYYGANGEALFGHVDEYEVCGCNGTFGGNPGYDDHVASCGEPNSCRDPNGLRDGDYRQQPSSACTAIATPDQQRASGSWQAGSYQWCCTSQPWVGEQIAALLMGFKQAWNHDPFFDYVDRWMSPPWNGPGAHGDGYLDSMYRTYRSTVGDGDPPPPPPPPPVPAPPVQLD